MRIVISLLTILIILTLCSCSAPGELASSSAPISSTTVTSSDISSETSEEKEESSSKKDTAGKKPSSSSKPSNSTSSKKPSGSTSSKKPSSSTTTQKDYIDTSKLTYTQKDVGKVVGYNSGFKQEIVVEKVKEGVNGTGQKYIKVVCSDGSNYSIVECEYCHEFPCPNGGGKKCSKYDIKLDGQITCQQCGKPNGNGYYGTCSGTIDWNNGGKITCHHYSNCLKCGKPVGDGYNGTCHVTWGKYSGITTCNHYD